MTRSLPLPVFPPASNDDSSTSVARPRLPTPGRHPVGVARIGLKKIAVRRAAVERRGPVRAATPHPEPTPGPTPGHAQPCDLSAWSRGLYGVFLPDRRQRQESIGFSDRRSI